MPIAKVSDKGFSLYVQKRQEEGHLDGKWEFPGGKINNGEEPKKAALREFKEEVGVALDDAKVHMLKIYPFDYKDRSVSLFTYVFYDDKNLLDDKLACLDFNFDDDFKNFNIPEANVKILEELSHYIETEYKSGSWERIWAM